MRILILKPRHIGDTLLLTPTLAGLRAAYPQAEIWLLVREGAQAILAGCPHFDHLFTTAQVEKRERIGRTFLQELKTARTLRRPHFDYVFELGDNSRGRHFAIVSRAARKYSVRPAHPPKWWSRFVFDGTSSFDWLRRHRVEKDYLTVHEFLPLPAEIPPTIFARESSRPWLPAASFTDFAVLQVGTRQEWNRWHREGWLEAARFLLTRVERLVLTCGRDPKETAEAAWLQEKLGATAISTGGEADWPEFADLLYRARLFLGPNTAAMHLAAACQCPVVALFGPTREMLWAPWRAPYRIVHPPYPVAEDDPREWVWKRRMEDIDVSEVLAACDALLRDAQTHREGCTVG